MSNDAPAQEATPAVEPETCPDIERCAEKSTSGCRQRCTPCGIVNMGCEQACPDRWEECPI